MTDYLGFIASAQRARLIPAIADSNKEQRAASILLAALAAVDEFRNTMLSTVGQRLGTRARIDCYTEVVLKKNPPNLTLRPDGLLIVTIGKKQWSALIEAKIGRADLNEEQLGHYIQLARLNNVDAVVTLSNQFAALPTHHPIRLPRSSIKTVELYHWSWMFVLTQATLTLSSREFASKDQCFILHEVVEYFKHPSTGVSSFDRMNPEWKDLVTKIRSNAPLSKSSPEVENSVASWHEEQRDLCLIMSRRLGRQVTVKLSRAHRQDPIRRLKDDCEHLVTKKELSCTLDIPDTAGPMVIEAHIDKRNVFCLMRLAAPQDKKRTLARVNWLIRQVAHCQAEDVFIKALWPGRAAATQNSLAEVRNNPGCLDSGDGSMTVQSFEVIMVSELGGKFGGTKTFIEKLEQVVPKYYEQIGQHLRAWVPSPPKLERADPVRNAQENPGPVLSRESTIPAVLIGERGFEGRPQEIKRQDDDVTGVGSDSDN